MQVLINLFQFCNWVEFAWIENWNWVLQIALGLQPLRQFNQHLIPRLPNPAMLLKKIWDVFFCFILLVLQATTKVAINQLWNYSRDNQNTAHCKICSFRCCTVIFKYNAFSNPQLTQKIFYFILTRKWRSNIPCLPWDRCDLIRAHSPLADLQPK